MANLPNAAPLADAILIELEQQHLIRAALKESTNAAGRFFR